MKVIAVIIMALGLTACATVNGARTDIGNGIQAVGEFVKPGAK